MSLIQSLRALSGEGQTLISEPMRLHTTFRVGGPADVLFLPRTEAELSGAIMAARDAGAPVTVVGNGSNLLVRDGGIRGLVIRLGENFSGIHIDGTLLTARAGDLLSCAAREALNAGLTGLEFASGIPGSVGGGMAMNAGAYGGQLSDVAESLRVMDARTGEVTETPASQMNYGYRTSAALTAGNIVTLARLRLRPGAPAEIRALMDDLNQRRRDKQPLSQPSAGSTFKRPEGHFAGALIEGAGLKGVCVGGAMVSPKHAGFIVNTGSATAADILNLIALVTARVYEKDGVMLEPEVRVLGED